MRIQEGADPDHAHPAQAVEAERGDAGGLRPSRTEARRGDRYAPVEVHERIPKFWPPRIWDRPEAQMSQMETVRMVMAIRGQRATARPAAAAPAKARSPRYGMAPMCRLNRPSVVVLQTESFITDRSDDGTDWEDF